MGATILRGPHKEEATLLWLNWGSKAVFAILDQGLFAGGNFIANILLARWISPESYGAFALAYSVFLLLSTFHTAALTAPLLVFGAGRYSDEFGKYLRLLLSAHMGLTGAMGLILIVAVAVVGGLGSTAVAQALLGVAIATPFILLIWFVRAACYVRFRPHWAAVGGALYLLLLTAGLYGIYRTHLLSPASGFAVMGLSSLVTGLWLLRLLEPQWWVGFEFPRTNGIGTAWRLLTSIGSGTLLDTGRQSGWEPARALHDHFRFAKWQSASSLTNWLVGNLHYFFLSSVAGLANVAVMRVLDTMLLPYFHYQAAISRLITPILGMRAKNPRADLLPYATRVTLLWASQAVVAYIVLRAFAGHVMSLLYGSAYSQYRDLLAWYGLIVIPAAVSEVLFALLQVMVRTDLIFLCQLLSSAGLLMGFVLAAKHGVPGIVLVLIVVSYAILPVQMNLTSLVLRNVRDGADANQAAEP